ncbi:MAG: hypothetical protein M1819_003959 [Sarea resinae]|nr:MAG: hypothetical protein M1819_003959 [Sarea resinae]
MTARGKQVKLQTLLTEKEIFVYDRQHLAPRSSGGSEPSTPHVSVPSLYSPKDPPDSLSNQNDLQAWQNLFKSRRAWTMELFDKCASMSDSIHDHAAAVNIIERGVGVAVENLRSHVRTLEQKYGEARTWASDVIKEHEIVVDGWNNTWSRLETIAAKESFLDLMHPGNTRSSPGQDRGAPDSDRKPVVTDLVDTAEIDKAGAISHDISERFKHRLFELEKVVEKITSDSRELSENVHRTTAGSTMNNSEEDTIRLLEDIEAVAKKVSSDYEHVLGLQSSAKSISQASKMALLHTRNYLPSLIEASAEMSQVHRQAVQQRNSSAKAAIRHMQTISAVESMLANVHSDLSGLDINPEEIAAFDLLTLVSRLPFAYGSLLIESVRRREWSEKMKTDSSTLAEEMAAYKEEEERRRRKWVKALGDFVPSGAVDGKAIGVEVNLQGEEKTLPFATREDVNSFLKELEDLGGMEEITKELSQLLKDLDRPTRQHAKIAKAFKNGSVHDAAFGRGSLLLRGEDDLVRSLKDDKNRLEDRLKGSESRVRKLEDLLHRQSQMGRYPGGNIFQPSHSPSRDPINQATSLSSPRHLDTTSRRSSVSSRRVSASHGMEDKALANRILSLEAELLAEREKITGLQNETSQKSGTDDQLKIQMEEAISTKKDLMDNLEAQQREFTGERKLLLDEIRKVKMRNDELEDEFDRILGSRDNEKSGIDERILSLEADLDKTRKAAAEEVQRAQGQVDFMKNDYTLQREKANRLESEIGQSEQQNAGLNEKVKELENHMLEDQTARAEALQAIRSAYSHLKPDEMPPNDLTTLAQAFELATERAVNHAKDLGDALALAQADIQDLKSKVSTAEEDGLAAHEKLAAEENKNSCLQEALSQEQARVGSLRKELDDERQELNGLRTRFADGETGSEALRSRVSQEESKVIELSGKLSAAESHARSLETELGRWQSNFQSSRRESQSTVARLESRTMRAKDLTQRLYSQNDRLNRLLESLGYAITRRDGSMIIQKVPRATSASATLSDPQSMSRTGSGQNPTRRALEDSEDLNLLYWMQADDSDTESEKYAAYLRSLGKFDVEAFSEAITKRVKETEHMARKWQKEARAYRDKSHRAQAEAHEKIAFRSFKEGDLALFLPTRNQATRPWAAFNVGAPHYFLREQDSHKLRTRDWLLARINKVEERVVDLSRSLAGLNAPSISDRRSIGEGSEGGASIDDENPFELSDGLRWYLLDAAEEKPGAPSTPGLGKSTVASAHVDAKGSIRMKKSSVIGGGVSATKTLSKSLDSRRSSSNSKKGVPPAAVAATGASTSINASSPASNGAASVDASRAGTSAGPPPTDGASYRPSGLVGLGLDSDGNTREDRNIANAAESAEQDEARNNPKVRGPLNRCAISHDADAYPILFQALPRELLPGSTTAVEVRGLDQSPRFASAAASKSPLSSRTEIVPPTAAAEPLMSQSSSSFANGTTSSKEKDADKAGRKPRQSLWDSLWSFDLSVESGRTRR